jgi:hypothetical protein
MRRKKRVGRYRTLGCHLADLIGAAGSKPEVPIRAGGIAEDCGTNIQSKGPDQEIAYLTASYKTTFSSAEDSTPKQALK